jgi:hypothetical protein
MVLPPDRLSGRMGRAADDVLARLRALAQIAVASGDSSRESLAAALSSASSDVVGSVRDLVMQVPTPTVPVDLLIEEIRAKRALVEAMQVQMASFASQLEVLERSLAPLQSWGRQWSSVQDGIADLLRTQPDGDKQA